MKKSSRYKKECAQSSSAWKKYLLIPFVAFSCGGLSVLGYYFFFKAPQQNVPTVEGYAVPARTYVAPQGEKTVQKIYDLDQSGERPIVEKILPSQDQPNTTTHPGQEAISPKSTPPANPEPPLENNNSLDLNIDAPPQKTPPQVSDHKPKAAPSSPLKHTSSRRIQVGPVFNDLQQAKAFLAQLHKTAKGYSFALQAREVQTGTRYRIVTQHALTPAQIQALIPLIPSSS